MNDPTVTIANSVRILMARLAKLINRATRGAVKPAHITLLSLFGHFPAAWALWQDKTTLAVICIVVFGLMDALDGALAREQKSSSKFGMFFDAVTDRLKEVLIYSGLAVYAYRFTDIAPWVVPALAGTSLLVSYVKSKGEMAVAAEMHDRQALNRVFSNGIARYEVRMSLLVLGLLSGFLAPLLNLAIALNLVTASERFMAVAQLLATEDQQAKIKHKKRD